MFLPHACTATTIQKDETTHEERHTGLSMKQTNLSLPRRALGPTTSTYLIVDSDAFFKL